MLLIDFKHDAVYIERQIETSLVPFVDKGHDRVYIGAFAIERAGLESPFGRLLQTMDMRLAGIRVRQQKVKETVEPAFRRLTRIQEFQTA